MKQIYCYGIGLVFLFTVMFRCEAAQNSLTISESERLAIIHSPELRQIRANEYALEQQAIAAGQETDPQLIVGAINVPTNTFSFSQDDMTMIGVGLQQSFAPGRSLRMKSKQTMAEAKAQQRKAQEQAESLLRNTRDIWLDLYYWIHALQIIRKNESLYRRLLKVVESQYSEGKANQSDVLQVQVDITRFDDQRLQAEQQIKILRAQLARLIGESQAQRPIAYALPHWRYPPPITTLQKQLGQHPVLQVDTANIEAAYHEVAYAKEQYKPGWMVDVGYGFRQGHMQNGERRSDMVTAQVTLDLPIFPGNRQNKRLQASAYQLEATELDRDTHYRDLRKELATQYAIWLTSSQREKLYKQRLMRETIQNSKATLLAYQNATTDMTTVLRAYSSELNVHLQELQIQVERAKARSALLYLEGVAA